MISIELEMARKNGWRSSKGSTRPTSAGTDISTKWRDDGKFSIEVDQEYYIESLEDVAIDPDRLRQEGPLLPQEVGACRAALGALQWLAIPSQPQLCARCNLLLTEVVTSGTLSTAGGDPGDDWRNPPRALRPSLLPACHRDPLERLDLHLYGGSSPEAQSILEAEDHNFRARLIWSELNGRGRQVRDRQDLVDVTERQTLVVKGILCTDSKGGYDAVETNESPLLGLSNIRAALQAFQLRDNLKRTGCELRWVASDYDLADALTKKRAEARVGIMKFLKKWLWSIAFDKEFISARKGKQQGRSAVSKVNEHLLGPSSTGCIAEAFWGLMQDV